MSFLRPNIQTTGRVLRALTGLVLIGSGAALLSAGWLLSGWAAIAVGVFCLFEAARGWCLARACGVKTRY